MDLEDELDDIMGGGPNKSLHQNASKNQRSNMNELDDLDDLLGEIGGGKKQPIKQISAANKRNDDQWGRIDDAETNHIDDMWGGNSNVQAPTKPPS